MIPWDVLHPLANNAEGSSFTEVRRCTAIPVLNWLFSQMAGKRRAGVGRWYPGSVDLAGRLGFIRGLPSWLFVADTRLFIPSVKMDRLSLCPGS